MYKVGDKVFYAIYGIREEHVPCPVCYGNKSVVLILGNGDEVEVECKYCQSGFNPPRGYIVEYVSLPKVEEVTITKQTVEYQGDNFNVTYVGSRGYRLYPDRMFDTYEDAENCANLLAEEDNLKKANSPKFKNEKSYSWNAGYHMKEADKCRRELLYHENAARLCKSRSKEK